MQRIVQRITSSRPGVWFFSRTAHHLDRVALRLTDGRQTLSGLLAGVPVVTLTTIGARSGQPRSVPLIGVVDGERVALIASNWGSLRHPAWYHNVRANPQATVTIGGRSQICLARPASEEERERYWQAAVRLYPGYAAYARRTGGRVIPVMVLEPL
ncbi:MAG: nitroreductase family deazaflavin-dependent oxidoreductase [Chloroflexota bacterium]